MTNEPVNQVEDQEQAFSENYKKAYDNLMAQGGYSPRKAKRFLDSIAKKNLKKFLKGVKKNGNTNTLLREEESESMEREELS